MIRSMTGYGSATFENEKIGIRTELKSVNNRYTEVILRIPRSLQVRDVFLRTLVGKLCERGTITLTITIQLKGEVQTATLINQVILQKYIYELNLIAEKMCMNPVILQQNLLQLPEVLVNSEMELSSDLLLLIEDSIQMAFIEMDKFRKEEGEMLGNLFLMYVDRIEQSLMAINELDINRLDRIKSRIRNNVNAVVSAEQIDTSRFEQELVYYIEKLDISEEKTRLSKHCSYFREMLNKEGTGKKLNFIAQEMGREINTIGSKANDFDIQQRVVMMKDELEKIKEQTLNVV